MMSVAEYEVKFDQLSRYAMHLIATEQDKCEKFEDGLWMEIKKGISIWDMHTFADLREAALRTERLIEEESSMVMEEYNVGKNLGKRKENFSSSIGASKGRNSGSNGGYPSRGDSSTR